MNQHDAAKIKQASGLPLICVGGWQTAGRIREALSAGHCDVVSIARGLLANPDLVQRFAEGRTNQRGPAPTATSARSTRCCTRWPAGRRARFDSREQMFDEAYRVYKEAATGVEG